MRDVPVLGIRDAKMELTAAKDEAIAPRQEGVIIVSVAAAFASIIKRTVSRIRRCGAKAALLDSGATRSQGVS
jgi:hypothetical protein